MPIQTRDLLRSTLMLALVAAVINLPTIALGAPSVQFSAPEIDPSSAASALAVLAGSGLILAERFGIRRK